MKAIATLTVLLVLLTTSSFALEANECKELGFISDEVLCSTCERLKNAVSSFTEEDVKLCKECCIDQGIEDNEPFQFAVLRLDYNKLKYYPELKQFVEEHSKGLKNKVEVKHVSYISAELSHLDADNNQASVLKVASWKADELAEYIQKRFTGKTD